MPTLTIHRDATPWVDRARAYWVKIDGEKRVKLTHGATVTVDLTPGPHVVKMAIDWCGSPEITVDGDADLRCWAATTPITALFTALIMPGRYIGLERAA